MAITRIVARPLLATTFFVGAYNALRNADALAGKARKVTDKVGPKAREAGVPLPDDARTLVQLNAAVQMGAAAALATGKFPRVASSVLAGSLVPTTIAGHAFWEETDPQMRNQQKLHFAKNVSVLGGLLLAALDTEGKPGVAWRAQRLAKDARRETTRAVKQIG